MVFWLACGLVCWQVGCLAGWLLGLVAGWLAGWLLVGYWLVACLDGCLLFGSLVVGLVAG